jgi:hypothetical protein
VGNGAASSFATNNLSADCIIYNMAQESGASILWGTNGAAPAAGTSRIRGNVTVQGTFAFKVANRGGSGIIFESGGSSTIGGAGTGTVSFAQTISIASGTTITVAHNIVDSTSWTVNGQMDLASSVLSGGGSFTVATGATLKSGHGSGINGNLTNSGGTALNIGANYEYNDAITQVTGALLPATVNNLMINNSNGLTLLSSLTVNGTLTLTSGNITTTITNLLTLGSLATVSGGSSLSFVDGPIAHTWTTATATKTYPLGKGATYRPLDIALTTPQSPVLRAEVFNANASGTSALNAISTVRYYQTSLVSGTAIRGGTVKITYGADDGVSDFSQLVVAISSTVNGIYLSLGGAAGDATTITSATAYDPGSGSFLLMGSTAINGLPVELTSFIALARNGKVELNWNTATEVNNYGFEVERKSVNNQQSTVGAK